MEAIDSVETAPPAGWQTPYRVGIVNALVAHIYDVTPGELSAPTRGGPRAALARQVAMYLAHVVFKMSVVEVAVAFGRQPSTACHAVHHVEDMRDDPGFDRTVLYLEAMLRDAVGVRR
jgi:chromosomal replication initiation ATPase DnaA